ncbi:alpha/beta fold hydrolase [Cupriavidus sp. CuC1]|uniref:alpha/beta fold hydrolase n=1 Tax=Cupriavidus sp. CuC1 TaxID=3373131 RepID=UPI0037CF4381
MTAILDAADCANSPPGSSGEPITIERQGSFFVGGRQVTAAGTFDPDALPYPSGAGQTFWIDQMYVQYQIPLNARKLPLVLVHGAGGTGRVWESTPDGREGFQTIFLRRGFPVYIVDLPRGGRSGFPSFTGSMGKLDDKQQVVPGTTFTPGREHAWNRWRLGPKYPEVFPVQAFPMNAVDQFLQHVRPLVSDDPQVISGALVALLEKIGPAVLVTHSASGQYGWLAGARSPNVKGIVSYEPGFVFPQGEVPPPIPLYQETQDAGAPIAQQEFAKLATVPIEVVYGDNIPKQPISDLLADGRRAQVITAPMFIDALNRRGGQASLLLLPDAGLSGNSHFMFSDLNNLQVADLLSAFLARFGLDAR